MKKIILAALVFGLLSAGTAFAQQNTASASANAQARVVASIQLTKNQDLNFGDVVAGGSLGTVVMSTAGVRSVTGGTTLGNPNGAQAAAFTVNGQAAATYAITLPGAPVTISSGGNNMTVDTWAGSKGTGTLSAGGSDNFSVGATLHVAANQATGSYTGTFNVSVNYN
jgi:hypothetical protein